MFKVRVSVKSRHAMAMFITGIVITAVSWVLAWTRIPLISEHSFFSLWLGYILTVNGVSEILFGRSLLSQLRASFVLLFLASCPFWWFFESINLIVRNWHYIFPYPISRLNFEIEATINFSTVLPAVVSTVFLFSLILQNLHIRFKTKGFTVQRRWLGLSVLMGGIFMTLLPVIPQIAFPLVWIAPTLIMEPILYSLRYPSLLQRIERGHWSLVASIMVATLFNGFWWECWNFLSSPKWVYTIPYVGFWKVFEMPILGYLGYPFFGLIIYSYTIFIFSVVFGRESVEGLLYPVE